MKKFMLTSSLSLLLFSANIMNLAADSFDNEKGFYGQILFGGSWERSDSVFDASIGDSKIIKSVNSNEFDTGGGNNDLYGILILAEIGYVTSSKIDIYFNLDKDIRLGLDFPLSDITVLRLETFYSYEKVWQDPYLLDTARSETDCHNTGVEISLEELLGTGLSLSYSLKKVDIEKDLLSEGDRKNRLGREGYISEAGFQYNQLLGCNKFLTPSFYYLHGDMDGRANSYDGWCGGLDYDFFSKYFILSGGISASIRRFDDYVSDTSETRRDDTMYEVHCEFTLINLFGIDNFLLSALAGYSITDGKAEFFDSEESSVGLSAGYSF